MQSVSEEWRPVVGLEGQYEVSSLGRVKSLPKMVFRGRGPFMTKERIIGGRSRAAGYPVVHVGAKCLYIHALVLEAFVGPRPSGLEACHNNGDRTDNRAENLRWDTPRANQMDRAKHGTSNRGEQCGTARLTNKQALEIMQSVERTSVLAKKYGVAPQTISGIRCGHKWNHLRETAQAG
jgi:hypothetical protein